jgi:hypothetical protein
MEELLVHLRSNEFAYEDGTDLRGVSKGAIRREDLDQDLEAGWDGHRDMGSQDRNYFMCLIINNNHIHKV